MMFNIGDANKLKALALLGGYSAWVFTTDTPAAKLSVMAQHHGKPEFHETTTGDLVRALNGETAPNGSG